VPTAAIFLAMYAYVLVAATAPPLTQGVKGPPGAPRQGSPAGAPALPTEPDSPAGKGTLPLCAVLSLAVLGIRATWTGLGSPWLVLADACLPAGVFAAALVAAMWTGRRLGGPDLAGGTSRFCLACGLAGFAAHSLVELAIWFPAAATAFWVAAGAAAGPGVWRRARSASRLAGPLTAALMTGVVAVGVWVWWPVQQKTFHLRAAQKAYAEGFGDPAARHLKLAAEADPLDSFPTGYLATIYVTASHTVPPWLSGQFVGDALRAAEETCRRNPDSPANHLLLAQILWRQGLHLQRALAAARQAVGMDPMNMQTRIEYARMLLDSGRLPAAAEQLAEVRRIDRERAPDDILRLTPEELREVEAMERQIAGAAS
jgi:tetratricopeptide (TPR) repeat protein